MAALTATGWTVSIEDQVIKGGRLHNRVKLTLATAGSYPSNGIPLPSDAKLGMKWDLSHIHLFDAHPNASHRTLYDHDNGTLRVFSTTASSTSPAEVATTVTLGSSATPFIVYLEAVGR